MAETPEITQPRRFLEWSVEFTGMPESMLMALDETPNDRPFELVPEIEWHDRSCPFPTEGFRPGVAPLDAVLTSGIGTVRYRWHDGEAPTEPGRYRVTAFVEPQGEWWGAGRTVWVELLPPVPVASIDWPLQQTTTVTASANGYWLPPETLRIVTDPEDLEFQSSHRAGQWLTAGEHTLVISVTDSRFQKTTHRRTLIVQRLVPTIYCNEPLPFTPEGGTFLLTREHFNATVSPGGGTLQFEGVQGLTPGSHKIKIFSPQSEVCEYAEKTIEFQVNPCRPKKVAWGQENSCTVNAQGHILLTRGCIVTEPEDIPLKCFPEFGTQLLPGQRELLICSDDPLNVDFQPVRVVLDVKRQPVTIRWRSPAAVCALGGSFRLTPTELCAVSNPPDRVLTYKRRVAGKLLDLAESLPAGTHELVAVCEQTPGFAFAMSSVELRVCSSEQERQGFEDMREPDPEQPQFGAFKQGALDNIVRQNWENNTLQVRTKAKSLIGDLSGMTFDEMFDWLNEKAKAKLQPGTQGNEKSKYWMFKLGDGLDEPVFYVRVKIFGDEHNNPEGLTVRGYETFSVEIPNSTCRMFSGTLEDVAAKINLDGNLSPREPGHMSSNPSKSYRQGAMSTNHFKCRSERLTQEILCPDRITMSIGETLSAQKLGIALKQPDEKCQLDLEPIGGDRIVSKNKLIIGVGEFSVGVSAGETKRCWSAYRTIKVVVTQSDPQLFWPRPPSVRAGPNGKVAIGTLLNAVVVGSNKTVQCFLVGNKPTQLSARSELPIGTHKVQACLGKVGTEPHIEHEIRVFKSRLEIEWTPPSDVEVGAQEQVVLSKGPNGHLRATCKDESLRARFDRCFQYFPPEGTRLGVAEYELQVVFPGSDDFEPNAMTVAFHIKAKPN